MHGRLTIILCACLALSGCHTPKPLSTLWRDRPLDALTMGHELPGGRLNIQSNFKVPDGDRLLRELNNEGDDVCQTLGLPCGDRRITVHLFRDAQSYGECLSQDFPNVPARRAFFLESDGQLAVYAHCSDRLAEDLRHEVAHGYLHAAVDNLPLWMDEGLAEYFEVPPGQGGFNPPHLDLLTDLAQHNGWRPDLERLERLNDIVQMDQQSYAESWAWIYFLLNSRPERRELLKAYLLEASSRRGPASPLSQHLKKFDAQPEQALADFLASLRNR